MGSCIQATRCCETSALYLSMTIFLLLNLLFLASPAKGAVAAVNCTGGNTIDCFECNSMEDARCHDPWNWTYPKTNMPPTMPCDGCCVKMVQFIGTHHYQIKRTCTDNFEVNFFMVNHAFMTEGHRHGHMCFCEEDECNGGRRINRHLGMIIPAVIILIVGLR